MFDFLAEKFSSVFSRITGRNQLTEKNINEALEKVKEALLEADVPYQVVQDFSQEVAKEAVGRQLVKSLKAGEQFIKLVHEQLVAFLGGKMDVEVAFQIPSVIMVLGLQGSGKTTTVAKIAHYVQQQAQKRGKKRNVLLASVDFYRPAAIDQLEILAKQLQVSFYRAKQTDPVKAAQEIESYFKKGLFDLLLLDTAGRLHVDNEMLQELEHIDGQLKPKYKLLVLDAMTGQESLNVAQAFEQGVGFTGAILTKMDSDTRAGAAFAFRYILKKPILFIGAGEKVVDLEQFYPDRMANRILGMGDVLSLIEKAEEKIKKEEQEAAFQAFSQGKMTLQDFAQQMDMMQRIGSLSQIVKYIPGMSGVSLSSDTLEKGEKELVRFRAIINSMTLKERLCPRILDNSRKKRIAQGAGVQVAEVNLLLERFEQSQQYVKLFKKFNKFGKFFK